MHPRRPQHFDQTFLSSTYVYRNFNDIFKELDQFIHGTDEDKAPNGCQFTMLTTIRPWHVGTLKRRHLPMAAKEKKPPDNFSIDWKGK